MLDTINLERRGIPAAVVGADRLVNTTGKGMARAQGYPDLRFAVLPYIITETEEGLPERAMIAAPQVERILLGRI